MGQAFEFEQLKGEHTQARHTHTHMGACILLKHRGYLMLSCLVVNWISLRVRQGIRLWACELFIGAYKCIRLHTSIHSYAHTHTPVQSPWSNCILTPTIALALDIQLDSLLLLPQRSPQSQRVFTFCAAAPLLLIFYCNSFFPVLMSISLRASRLWLQHLLPLFLSSRQLGNDWAQPAAACIIELSRSSK